MTCPRPPGKLEEGLTLESVSLTHLHYREKEVTVRTEATKEDVQTAAEQNRCGTDLGLCNYYWVTDPLRS